MQIGSALVRDPHEVSVLGNEYTLECITSPGPESEALMRDLAVLGRVVPVTGEASGAVPDGVYVVEAVEQTPVPGAFPQPELRTVFLDIVLRRQSVHPTINLVYSSRLRTNTGGVTDTEINGLNAAIVASSEPLVGSEILQNTGVDPALPVVGGTIARRAITSGSSGSVSYRPTLEGWHTGAALIEVHGTDGVWRPVGEGSTRVEPGALVSLSNGLVRMEPQSDGTMLVSGPDSPSSPSKWTSGPWPIGIVGGGMSFLRVLRNELHVVSIEMSARSDAQPGDRIVFTLYRGASMVIGQLLASGGLAPFQTVNPAGWSAITGPPFAGTAHGTDAPLTWVLTSTSIASTGDGTGSVLGEVFAVGVGSPASPQESAAQFFAGVRVRQEFTS